MLVGYVNIWIRAEYFRGARAGRARLRVSFFGKARRLNYGWLIRSCSLLCSLLDGCWFVGVGRRMIPSSNIEWERAEPFRRKDDGSFWGNDCLCLRCMGVRVIFGWVWCFFWCCVWSVIFVQRVLCWKQVNICNIECF